MTEQDNEQAEIESDFGSLLAEARKTRNYTVAEISGHLKIPENTIIILESNDLEALPAPTFAQGYIRAYAKFLEISEEAVLEKYYLAVPNASAADLKPRSNLPGEASSQSPLVKSVTILLIIAGIAAVIFGSFTYYQEKAGVMEGELDARAPGFVGNSLDSPGSNRLNFDRDEPVAEDRQADPYESIERTTTELDDVTETEVIETEVVEQVEDVAEEALSENDKIEFFAENGSWMEVRDANKSRLFYNMVPVGGSKVLTGKAPFSITMGNATTTRVVINDLDVDMTDYIRSNNTAIFSISTDGQGIIFH